MRFIPLASEGWKSENRVPMWMESSDGSVLGSQIIDYFVVFSDDL